MGGRSVSSVERRETGFTPKRRSAENGFTFSWRSAENGFTPSWRSAENGFTLIEMLVALAIFSLAALALLRLEGATVSTTAQLQEQGLAQIVARNVAVEALTDPVPPAMGSTTGEAINAGRHWRWTRITGSSPEPRIQQIAIHVQSPDGPASASLVIFRRAPQ
jgi:general secretion pathway protein I